MNKLLRAVSLVGALAFMGLAPGEASAQGCCSPVTSYRMGSGRSNAGRPYLSTGGSRATGVRSGRMSMQGMNMSGMNMNGTAASQNLAPAASAAPVSRGAAYFCPMHPNVISTFPATCPYCQMALNRR